MTKGKRPYKPSEAFERFWRGWFPARHRPRPKPARTYEGCEEGRGWHLWSEEPLEFTQVGDGPVSTSVVCRSCNYGALAVARMREQARLKPRAAGASGSTSTGSV